MADLGLLERNSLYIATQALPSPETGKFHWSFFITNSKGGAEQHHWSKPYGAHDAGYEARSSITDIGALTNFSKYLTFTKIEAQWSAPPSELLYESMSLVFGDGATIVNDDQTKGLSRLWITDSIRKFKENGWLNIPNKQAWDAVEQNIIRRSSVAIEQHRLSLKDRSSSFCPLPVVLHV